MRAYWKYIGNSIYDGLPVLSYADTDRYLCVFMWVMSVMIQFQAMRSTVDYQF